MRFDQPPVVRVTVDPERGPRLGEWPLTVPAIAQLEEEGLHLDPGVTFLVGENGSGKSTLVEGVALAYGLSPEGGSTHSRHATRTTESDLHQWLRLERGLGASRWGSSCAPRPCTAGSATSTSTSPPATASTPTSTP